jgi:hypothetical protein
VKTYPITDHIPEPEFLAITPDGAARWLRNHDWYRIVVTRTQVEYSRIDISNVYRLDSTNVSVRLPPAGEADYVRSMAEVVMVVAHVARSGPRTIIAEMQADSRIMAALRTTRSVPI